jgi:hypothetical protein
MFESAKKFVLSDDLFIMHGDDYILGGELANLNHESKEIHLHMIDLEAAGKISTADDEKPNSVKEIFSDQKVTKDNK